RIQLPLSEKFTRLDETAERIGLKAAR
ncbi:MAG: hypothetical protein JWM76_3586, partial [Pseudonocardiales bacterium]|nr:hypothetical protein [Pseudonocardiales bacterium]